MNLRPILLSLLIASCGPRVRPVGPGEGPAGGVVSSGGQIARGGGPPVALGEMCPERADGRPAVSVLLLGRGLSWSDDDEELEEAVTGAELSRFGVFGWNGKRAGIFTGAGATSLANSRLVSIGGYAGAAVCADDATSAICRTTLAGCGVAVAGVGPEGEDPPAPAVGGACLVGDKVVIDVDGDGAKEGFAAADFLDVMRVPSEEVVGAADASACEPAFAVPNLLVGTSKAFRGMDLIAVLDLDADGRMELIFQLRYGEKRTWTVYAASQVSTRLELIAEIVPWGS